MNMRKKYIKKFNTQSEYLQFVDSQDFVIPNVSYIRSQNRVYFNNSHDEQYLTFIAIESGTFKFQGNDINYSLDNGSTWTTLTNDTYSPTVPADSKIMWKATLTSRFGSGIGFFGSTGRFIVEGNAMSLLHGDNFIGQNDLSGQGFVFYLLFKGCSGLIRAKNLVLPATTLAYNCYDTMFYNCTSLTTAPELPATTLEIGCYKGMFYGCTSLTTAPELPATTSPSDCYEEMFYGCTSLTTAPELPATTLESCCYRSMFYNCTSLTTAPELPATTLAVYCYDTMFYNCTSLTTAPELPATTLADDCYNEMFYGCTSLTTAPELPATTLARWCYMSMFNGCTSLTTAPELPATTLVYCCYYRMFQGCTSLNSITCLATDISADACTINWLDGVSDNGTFTKASSMSSWTTGEDGIPSDWTVQNAS